MKILTQNLKTGNTKILDVPSPQTNTNKVRVQNKYSLISTGTEASIVNFGKDNWINKARKQPDKVKDVINKIKSSGIVETYKAIRNKLDSPIVMGYSAVGAITHNNKKYNLNKGDRVFTNSCHQEEALVDYEMCIKIPDSVDDKSACFGSIGGIAMQSIKCIPLESKFIVLIGLGLLGQVTSRLLNALGYKCLVYDLDIKKVRLAEEHGSIGIKNNIAETVLHHTKGKGSDCTIIAAASLSSDIVNNATSFTKRKGKIISSGVVGLNLVRDKFFKKQIELVVSNSSGDKNHKGEGSSYENIRYFFELLSLKKVQVLDLISEEISFKDSQNIYSKPSSLLFFSKLIKYDKSNVKALQTFSDQQINKETKKIRVGLVGAGNFARSILMPKINSSKDGYLAALLGREGLPLYIAKERFNVNTITTNELDFYKNINAIFISSPHETHYKYLKKAIELSLPVYVEKPLVITNKELIDVMKKMLSNEMVYAIGYNRSFAPWTKFIKNKIKSRKTNIEMVINAGKLPLDHWLLNENTSGGRILGELCHFVDLSLTILNHTKLLKIECKSRDRYYQDCGNYILSFEDGSIVDIDYRYDLPASLPKERIKVNFSNEKYINNNWKKFTGNSIFSFSSTKKGKGHSESISSFLSKSKNNNFTSKNEIFNICFSTYTSIKLQKMSKGDIINISDCFSDEILSKM